MIGKMRRKEGKEKGKLGGFEWARNWTEQP